MKNKFLDIAIKAAREAGKVLVSRYGNIETKFKNNNFDVGSIVTEADLESETKIVDILSREFPNHGIHGEEGFSINEVADYIWFIDPLDGTSNFTRNIPIFGISIGLIHKGESVLGVLYFPALDLLVHGAKSEGTFANNRKTNVSNRPLEKSLYYSGGKFAGKQQLHMPLADQAAIVKIIDASSYELAQIAMGDAEIYYLENVLHDVAAGICIINEAGGKVTDQVGNPWQLDSKMILATNGVVHDQVLKLIK